MTLAGLSAAFARCVGELGMWSAARLFVSTAQQHGGDEAVQQLIDTLGTEFPVVTCVADAATAATAPDVASVAALCDGLKRVVVVGLEADCLAPLLDALPSGVACGVLVDSTFVADSERLKASWGQRATLLDVASYQSFAGSRSALLTTVYGSDGFRAVVTRAWMRCHGDDVRTVFRQLIGWNVMAKPMEHYPRWLVETDVNDFTVMVGP